MTQYTAWTAKQVELRILEAAETCLRMPPVKGPQIYGNNMPEPVRDLVESYAYGKTKVKRSTHITPGALARMEETWGWINAYLSEADRHVVYGWSYAKKHKRRSLGRYARDNRYSVRTLYRVTRKICSQIAGNLNKNHIPNLTLADFERKRDANQIKSKISAQPNETYWMAPGAKPVVTPEVRENRRSNA